MKEVFLGEVIKQRRIELKLTQEQLCEGICEPITISRMENGKQTPSRNHINAILQRLGLPDDRYYALLSKNEMEIEALKKEILACEIRFERARAEERLCARESALHKLFELEKIMDDNDRITRQYILSIKAALGKEDGPYTFTEKLELLLEAIQLTVPRFNLDEINNLLYSIDETRLINQIAVTYSSAGKHEKAIEIYNQLLNYIQKHDQYLAQYAGHLSLVAHNYSRELGLCKRYEDALEVAELGKKTCIEYAHYQFLPGFLAIMAECKFFLHDLDQSSKLYCQAHYIYAAIGDEHNLQIIDNEIKTRLNLKLMF